MGDYLAAAAFYFGLSGDELVPHTIPLPIGKATETNGLVLKAKVEEWGAKLCFIR